jgi:predicted transcriptional regulator
MPFYVGLTVTDATLSFGLCRHDDLKYDISSDLIAINGPALAWGKRLFSHYREISEEFTII